METLIALFGTLGALLIGAISPEPSFVLVAHTTIEEHDTSPCVLRSRTHNTTE